MPDFDQLQRDALKARQDNVWSDFAPYPRSAWRDEVTNCTTNLGYWDWVDHRIEGEADPQR